jgi:hypothetical protein
MLTNCFTWLELLFDALWDFFIAPDINQVASG